MNSLKRGASFYKFFHQSTVLVYFLESTIFANTYAILTLVGVTHIDGGLYLLPAQPVLPKSMACPSHIMLGHNLIQRMKSTHIKSQYFQMIFYDVISRIIQGKAVYKWGKRTIKLDNFHSFLIPYKLTPSAQTIYLWVAQSFEGNCRISPSKYP